MMIRIEVFRVSYPPKYNPATGNYRKEFLGKTWISDLKRKALGLGWDDLGHWASRLFPKGTHYCATECRPKNWFDGGDHWIITGSI